MHFVNGNGYGDGPQWLFLVMIVDPRVRIEFMDREMVAFSQTSRLWRGFRHFNSHIDPWSP